MLSTLTPEQQMLRASGIGASEIAAIAGLSPFQGAVNVYDRKVNPVIKQDEPSVDQKRGIFIEDGIRQWYAHETKSVVSDVGTLPMPGSEIMMASPDGLVEMPDGTRRGLEIKCPRFPWHWENDDGRYSVPDYYIAQTQIESAVLGVDSTDVAVLLAGELHIINVPYEKDFADDLRSMGEAFWHNHVLTKTPPSPDKTKHFAAWLKEKYGRVNLRDQFIQAPESAEHWINIYMNARDGIRTMEAAKLEAANHLADMLKEAPGFELPLNDTHQYRVTYKPRDYPAIKADKLLAAGVALETIEACKERNTQRTLDVRKVKVPKK